MSRALFCLANASLVLLGFAVRPSPRAEIGWTLGCDDKPEASAWTDAHEPEPPFSAVEAWVYWSSENDGAADGWARAEGGGKAAVYAAIPHGVWVWAAWRIGEDEMTASHHEFCP